MLKSEIKIKIAYETLKFNSRKKEFSFAKEYQAATAKLREKFHEKDIALFWPTLNAAKSTTSSERLKYVGEKSTRVKKTQITLNLFICKKNFQTIFTSVFVSFNFYFPFQFQFFK